MNGGIRANMGELTNLGNKVVAQSEAYVAQVNKIYSTVDSLSSKWEGTDNQQYVQKVNEYKPDIQNLGEVIRGYGEFLKSTSNTLQQVQNDIASAASRL